MSYTDRLVEETEELEEQLDVLRYHIHAQQQKESEVKFELFPVTLFLFSLLILPFER